MKDEAGTCSLRNRWNLSNCDRVMPANRKNHFGCYAENRLAGAELGQGWDRQTRQKAWQQSR